MPELPEAESIVRALHQSLRDLTVQGVSLTREDIVRGCEVPLATWILGKKVAGVTRRGKRVVLDLEPQARLVFRLGMSGRMITCEAAVPVEPHTHLRIRFRETDRELRFRDPRRFGGVWCFSGPAVRDAPGSNFSDLGPEPLSLTRIAFRRLLSRRRQIKALLMDQRAIAGLGNIYCDESLHAAAIHPLNLAADLADKKRDRLLRAIKSTLLRAIRHNGSTLVDYRQPDGEAGSFQRMHRVYQREGEPCRSCRTRIVRILAAGRSTFFCPKCQSR